METKDQGAIAVEKPRVDWNYDKMRVLTSFAYQRWNQLNQTARQAPAAFQNALNLRDYNPSRFPHEKFDPDILSDEEVLFLEANLRGHPGHDDIAVLVEERRLEPSDDPHTSYNQTLIDSITYKKPQNGKP